MASANRDNSIGITIHDYEGGYSNDAHDPGGPTKYGITITDARLYWKKDATAQDVKDMPIGVAISIYVVRYWNIARLDEVPAGPDFATFDYNVNSGVSRGVKALQKAVGVPQDGKVGDATIAAAVKADPVSVVKAICAARLSFLHGLTNWRYFGGGWGKRVANVEARGVKMALQAQGHEPAKVQTALETHADEAKSDADKALVKGSVGPAGTGAVHAQHDLSILPHWLLIAGGVVLVVVAAFFIWKAYQHRQRAAAYTAVAKES